MIEGRGKDGRDFKFTPASEYEEIHDEFCGALKLIPGGGVLAKGFTYNRGHVHSKFTEVYMVTEGTLTLVLHSPSDGSITEHQLSKYDSMTIHPGVGHKVIGGSPDNAVLVTSQPAFVPGDEKPCEVLEARYAKPTDSGDSLSPLSLPVVGRFLALANFESLQ